LLKVKNQSFKVSFPYYIATLNDYDTTPSIEASLFIARIDQVGNEQCLQRFEYAKLIMPIQIYLGHEKIFTNVSVSER
jgi:hypothetical protein